MIEAQEKTSDEIFNILFNSDEITWQSMIYELVSSEKMDPWDIDISFLSNKFLEKLKKLKEMDLKISGKVLLAAAILLRVKSYRFFDEDISALDALINSVNSPSDELFEGEVENAEGLIDSEDKPALFPRTPQPRKRKVSVFDLVNALEKALEVFNRRPVKLKDEIKITIPEKGRDITLVIRDVYNKVVKWNSSKKNGSKKLTFNMLLENDSREEKVFTFIPLLHLDNQRKVDLMQEKHLGEIGIELLEKAE